ncbi:hypothetical protein D3C77_248630 [compost metagenome]
MLIRINGASGTLFDESFLKYQVSELTRLRQISAEIFVIKGLDAALNIDRESFNVSHPHYQIIKNWLHTALRQLMNKHKYLSSAVSRSALEERKNQTFAELHNIVAEQIKSAGLAAVSAREVIYRVTPVQSHIFDSGPSAALELNREKALAPIIKSKNSTPKEKVQQILNEEKAKALASILSAYGVDQHLPKEKLEELISAILEVMVLEIRK